MTVKGLDDLTFSIPPMICKVKRDMFTSNHRVITRKTMSDTEPAPPPLPAEGLPPTEKCLHCGDLVPVRRKSFCSADCESRYVKTTLLRPKKQRPRRR